MKIFSIRLLSVPFDNSYRNVFSAINSLGEFYENYDSELIDFLIANYPNYVIENPAIKSVKRNELHMSFNISLDSVVNVYDYNYAIVVGQDRTFWFINGFIEENDCNSKNYKVKFELDVWANYQYLIYNESRQQLVARTHIQQLQKKYITEEERYVCIPKNDLSVYPDQDVLLDYEQSFENFENREYKILWIHYRVTDDCTFQYGNAVEPNTSEQSYWHTNFGTYSYSSGAFQDCFKFVCMYDKYGNLINNRDIILRGLYGQDTTAESPYLIGLRSGEDIVECSYTFQIPSEIDVTYESDKIVVNVLRGMNAVTVKNNAEQTILTDVYIYADPALPNVPIYADTYTGINDVFYGYPSDTFEKAESFYNIDEKFSIRGMIETIPLMNRYPFVKRIVKFGKEEPINLIEKKYDDNFEIKCTPKCDGIIYYISGGSASGNYYNNEITPSIVSSNTSLPISTSQYDIYMRNNGQRISTQLQEKLAMNTMRTRGIEISQSVKENMYIVDSLQNAVSTFLSAKSGDIGGAISSGSKLITDTVKMEMEYPKYYHSLDEMSEQRKYIQLSHEALLNDLSAQKDLITVQSNGESDTIYQDGVKIYEEKIAYDGDKTTHNNFEALYYINLFGFNVNEYMNITEFPMRNFVYLKTVNCALTSKVNLAIKSKLEEILNSGVRCWRISADNNFVKNMDYNCSNYFNTEAIK